MPPKRSSKAALAIPTLPNAKQTAKRKKQLVGSPSIDDLSAKKLVKSVQRRKQATAPISIVTRRQKEQQQQPTESLNDDGHSSGHDSSQGSLSSASSNYSISSGSNYSSPTNSREPSPTNSSTLIPESLTVAKTTKVTAVLHQHTKRSLRAASKAIVQREKDREQRKRKSPSLSPPPSTTATIPSPTATAAEIGTKPTTTTTVKRKKRKINAQKIVLPSSQSTDSIDNVTGDISWNTYLSTTGTASNPNAFMSHTTKPHISTSHTPHTKKSFHDSADTIPNSSPTKKEQTEPQTKPMPTRPLPSTSMLKLDLSHHSILPNASYIAHLPPSSKVTEKTETQSRSPSVSSDMEYEEPDDDTYVQERRESVVDTFCSSLQSSAMCTDSDQLASDQYIETPTQQSSATSTYSSSAFTTTNNLNAPLTIVMPNKSIAAEDSHVALKEEEQQVSMSMLGTTSTSMDVNTDQHTYADSPSNFYDAMNGLDEEEEDIKMCTEDDDEDAYSTATSSASPSPISPSPPPPILNKAVKQEEIANRSAKTSSSGKFGFWNAFVRTFTNSK